MYVFAFLNSIKALYGSCPYLFPFFISHFTHLTAFSTWSLDYENPGLMVTCCYPHSVANCL